MQATLFALLSALSVSAAAALASTATTSTSSAPTPTPSTTKNFYIRVSGGPVSGDNITQILSADGKTTNFVALDIEGPPSYLYGTAPESDDFLYQRFEIQYYPAYIPPIPVGDLSPVEGNAGGASSQGFGRDAATSEITYADKGVKGNFWLCNQKLGETFYEVLKWGTVSNPQDSPCEEVKLYAEDIE